MMTSSHLVDLRDVLSAVDEMPPVMVAASGPVLDDDGHFKAAIHDFFKHLLGSHVDAGLIDQLVDPAITLAGKRMLLLVMGIASAPRLYEAILPAIKAMKTRIDAAGHVIKEIVFLATVMTSVIHPDAILAVQDRKEELARKVLRIFGVGIRGETREESELALQALDTVEYRKLSSDLEVVIRQRIQQVLAERAAAAAAAAAKPTRE